MRSLPETIAFDSHRVRRSKGPPHLTFFDLFNPFSAYLCPETHTAPSPFLLSPLRFSGLIGKYAEPVSDIDFIGDFSRNYRRMPLEIRLWAPGRPPGSLYRANLFQNAFSCSPSRANSPPQSAGADQFPASDGYTDSAHQSAFSLRPSPQQHQSNGWPARAEGQSDPARECFV